MSIAWALTRKLQVMEDQLKWAPIWLQYVTRTLQCLNANISKCNRIGDLWAYTQFCCDLTTREANWVIYCLIGSVICCVSCDSKTIRDGYTAIKQPTGIGGVGGYFWYTPPGRKFFENTPLEMLGKFFEKPGKTEKFR